MRPHSREGALRHRLRTIHAGEIGGAAVTVAARDAVSNSQPKERNHLARETFVRPPDIAPVSLDTTG